MEYKPKSEGAKAFMELAERISKISGLKARVMQ